jgi:hypothetical protein
MSSNRDRIKFLDQRVNELASLIQNSGREKEYMEYLSQIAQGKIVPEDVDEDTWNLLLPTEKDAKLFAHYHTMRTEHLSLMRKADEPTTLERAAAWFESPWFKTAIASATLIDAAKFFYQILSQTGLFLDESTDQDKLRT